MDEHKCIHEDKFAHLESNINQLEQSIKEILVWRQSKVDTIFKSLEDNLNKISSDIRVFAKTLEDIQRESIRIDADEKRHSKKLREDFVEIDKNFVLYQEKVRSMENTVDSINKNISALKDSIDKRNELIDNKFDIGKNKFTQYDYIIATIKWVVAIGVGFGLNVLVRYLT